MSDDDAPRDCFGPPRTSVLVGCLHCREIYESYLIWFNEERGGPATTDGRRGFWSCPTQGCGGIGFTFDIWPIDPDYRDEETGELLWVDDGYDEDALGDEDGEWFAPDPKAAPGGAPDPGPPHRDRPPEPGGDDSPGSVRDDEVPF